MATKILSPAKKAAGVLTRAERSALNKKMLADQQAKNRKERNKTSPPTRQAIAKKEEQHEKTRLQKTSGQSPLMKNAQSLDRNAVMQIVFERVATSTKSLAAVCLEPHEGWEMPSLRTVMLWMAGDDTLQRAYAHAKKLQAEVMADELLTIADDGSNDTYIDENGFKKTDTDVLGRSRLRVDTRRWLLSKLNPKRYGDAIKLTGDDAAPMVSKVLTPEAIAALSNEELEAALKVAEAFNKPESTGG